MVDLIVIVVLLLIVGAAGLYIWKAKKKGVKCIGCPAAAQCSGKCSGEACSSCSCHVDEK